MSDTDEQVDCLLDKIKEQSEHENARQDQTYLGRVLAEHDATEEDMSGDEEFDSSGADSEDGDDFGSVDMEDYASDESSIYICEDSDDDAESSDDDDPDLRLPEDAKGELAWRLGQGESYSDWSIEVSVEGRRGGRATGKKTYHVHRERLATGVRKCGYFAALFSSAQFKESEERISRITLPKDAADAFPAFLDFLYLPLFNANEVVDAENMRALRYLANYFLTPKLNEVVNKFIETDMRKNIGKLEAYLSEFGSDGSDEARTILGAGAVICAEKVRRIGIDSTLLFNMSPAFFLQVFTLLRAKGDVENKLDDVQGHICKLAVAYLKKHKHALDEAYFSALSRLLHLPDDTEMAGEIALELLGLIKEMGWTNSHAMLQSFVAALSRSFELTDVDVSPARISEVIKKIPTEATAMILSDAINGKKNESVTGDDVDITFCIKNDHFGKAIDTEIELTLFSTDTIRSVKYFLSRNLGAPDILGNIRLVKVGSPGNLQDHKTLSDYGMDEGSHELRVWWEF